MLIFGAKEVKKSKYFYNTVEHFFCLILKPFFGSLGRCEFFKQKIDYDVLLYKRMDYINLDTVPNTDWTGMECVSSG